MKWTDQTITDEIHKLMEKMNIDRMPNTTEMRDNKLTGLSAAIGKTGGMKVWQEKLGLRMKETEKKWTEELIETEIKKCVEALQIDRMPNSNELKMLKREDLHNAISRSTLKYSGWSKKMNLELKESETTKALRYELLIKTKLEGFNDLTVEKMTTKHPYDLLINGCVKVDVKVAAPHYHFGPRAHTFGLNKKYASCDIYICVALSDMGNIEKFFIIPAAHVQITTLNICGDSKYNKYINQWDFVNHFVNRYEEAINI